MKDDSRCPKNIYCDFERTISNTEVQVEVCKNCGKKVAYPKDSKGRVEKAKYLRDHVRDTVQPFGRTRKLFLKIYGEEPVKKLYERFSGKKSKAQIQREWEDLRKDIARRAGRIYV